MKAALGIVVLASCSAPTTTSPPPKPEPPPPVVAPPPPPAPDAFVVVIPDTPAGETLHAMLESFNSGDQAKLQAFITKYKSPPIPFDFYAQTGGFDLVAIRASEPQLVVFVVKEKKTANTAIGWLRVKDSAPPEIELLDINLIPPGQTADDIDIHVDADARVKLVDAIVGKLSENYIYPDLAKAMGQALREHAQKGDYDAITDGLTLAPLLTEHLRAVSHDKHLAVKFSPVKQPERADGEPSDDEKAQFRKQLEAMNCGFEKSERLDGNIGYVKFDMFGEEEVCGPIASKALDSLGDVDALIFDIRDNGGGEPAMVTYVVSYMFAKRTHVNDLYERRTNKTTEYWTKDVPGKKFVKQPVYVLTSARTFSGAEEFAYDLQTTKRATIVGEVTGGGAHPTDGTRLDDHFVIAVPFARAVNPITKTDWEGKGIQPDVKVPADQALDKAKQLAAEKLAKRHGGGKAH